MSQKSPSLATPLIVLIVGLVLIILLLWPAPRPLAAPQLAYTGPELTATSVAATQGYVPPSGRTATAAITLTPATATQTSGPTAQTTTTSTATATAGTSTSTVTTVTTIPTATTRTSTSTPQPTATPTGPTDTPAPPTPTPLADLNCVPGLPVEIVGEGPARAGVLLYFNGRAVGGGSVEPNGMFLLRLVVGNERPGVYQVLVRVRGANDVLFETNCAVPPTTPTPLTTRTPSAR